MVSFNEAIFSLHLLKSVHCALETRRILFNIHTSVLCNNIIVSNLDHGISGRGQNVESRVCEFSSKEKFQEAKA